MFKKLTFISALFVFGFIVQLIRYWPSSNLELVFCDVDQGDSILIKYGFWQMLIDTGPGDQVLECLRQNMPFWDKSLEVLLITHTDADHIGGCADVLNNYQIDELFLADTAASETYKNVLKQLLTRKSQQTKIKSAFLGQQISFTSGGRLLFLAPDEGRLPMVNSNANSFSETLLSDATLLEPHGDDDPNERSIILLLKYFNFDFLLMGDASQENELALLDRGLIKNVEGIKIGHHGSKTSSNQEFISKIQPETAVISCGYNNKFGHPSLEVMQILNRHQVQVLRTDELGTIKLITDGNTYWISSHKCVNKATD